MGWFSNSTMTFSEAMSKIICYVNKTGATHTEFKKVMKVVHGNDAEMQIEGMIKSRAITRQ